MRNTITLLVIISSLFKIAKAQDQLFKTDNTKLLVKIIEIGPEEIKYKLFSNPNGPQYSESTNDFVLVIFENGKHETFNQSATKKQYVKSSTQNTDGELTKKDSAMFYKYSNNISINFFNFFNNEIGLMYQREFFKGNFNIIVPISFGVEKPGITQSTYFGNTNDRNYRYGALYTLNRKLFDIGFGINYYPSLGSHVNYFIGPVFRYMQYDAIHTYNYRDSNPSNYNLLSVTKSSLLTRYCVSITNGFVFRTKSRLTAMIFGSLGFKNDIASTKITDPITNLEVSAIKSPLSLFFWTGFNVGFSF
jgi:hypothetical protein